MEYDITDATADWAQDTALLTVFEQECRSCGYDLSIHYPAWATLGPDPNGGCPRDELDAMRRWGLM